MFRWPVALTPCSLGSAGLPREAVLEITPRAAAFTLAALSHVGHAAHLALIDAYLKGQVRLSETAAIGQDSRTVAASLAVPLIAAAELGVERLTLADLILLPRDLTATDTSERSATGQPTRSPDCARVLLRAGDTWHWVRGAERFEKPGCLGTKHVGVGEPWHDVIVELPDAAQLEASARDKQWPVPIAAEVRAPSLPPTESNEDLATELRARALGRFGRAPRLIERSVAAALSPTGNTESVLPLDAADLLAERTESARRRVKVTGPAADPEGLARLLAEPIERHQPTQTSLSWQSSFIDVMLAPDADGYQTLCLLPPPDADPASIGPAMLHATRAVIEALIGRPLAEHRSDPIALTLQYERDGQPRTTTLMIGESAVIVRNQVVFTAWVGSDGRAMLKLFPPGGMR